MSRFAAALLAMAFSLISFSSANADHHYNAWFEYFEGTWKKQGENWIYEYEGYNLDSKKCTGKRVMTPVSNGRFASKDVSQTMDGEPQPNMEWVFERKSAGLTGTE